MTVVVRLRLVRQTRAGINPYEGAQAQILLDVLKMRGDILAGK